MISLKHFTNKIDIVALNTKYFRKRTFMYASLYWRYVWLRIASSRYRIKLSVACDRAGYYRTIVLLPKLLLNYWLNDLYLSYNTVMLFVISISSLTSSGDQREAFHHRWLAPAVLTKFITLALNYFGYKYSNRLLCPGDSEGQAHCLTVSGRWCFLSKSLRDTKRRSLSHLWLADVVGSTSNNSESRILRSSKHPLS